MAARKQRKTEKRTESGGKIGKPASRGSRAAKKARAERARTRPARKPAKHDAAGSSAAGDAAPENGALTPTSRGFAALTELLGRRAGLRVIWELRGGPMKFRALQAACDGLSPSTLNQRLADLRDARLVTIEERQGYCLTPPGEELVEQLGPLAGWADSWSHRRAQKRRAAR